MLKIKLNNVYDFFLHIVCFLVVISSASIWVQTDLQLISPGLLRYAIWILVIFLGLVRIRQLDYSFLMNLLLILVCAVGYSVMNVKFINGGLTSVFIPLLLFYLLTYVNVNHDRSKICEAFVNVMCIMAVVSLIFYVLASLLKLIGPTGYYSFQWSWISKVPSYFNLYYEPMPKNLQGFLFTRNCGIFPEAPMYNFPLCVAIAIQELLLEKKKLISIILLIAIITTGSTTGYLFLLILYGYKFIKQRGFNNNIVRIIITLAGVSFVAYVSYAIFLSKTATGSYSVRFDHLIACMETALRTNFLGSGIGNQNILTSYMSYKQGASVGIPYLLAIGGIFPTMLVLIPMLKTVIESLKARNTDVLCFTVLFFFIVFMTQVVFRNSMWFIIAIIFMDSRKFLSKSQVSKIRTE